MTDYLQDRNRGERAALLLKDELLQEAFEAAEKKAIEEWKASFDPQERERAWQRVQALADVQQELRKIMADGQYADEVLKRRK